MKKIISLIFIITTLTCAAQQQKINFTAPLMYPEGVAYSKATNMFYVSSVKTGSIGSVDFNGNYKVIYSDSTLKSSYGMKADDANKKIVDMRGRC